MLCHLLRSKVFTLRKREKEERTRQGEAVGHKMYNPQLLLNISDSLTLLSPQTHKSK